MTKKIFLIIVLLLLPLFVFAQRETEITYPKVGDMENVMVPNSVKTALPDYIEYIYTIFVSISGLLCFGAFIFAGAQFMTSVGNPGQRNKARSRLISSLVGIALILGSYLLFNTINPQLVTPSIDIDSVGGAVEVYESISCEGDHVKVTSNDPNLPKSIGDEDAVFDCFVVPEGVEVRVETFSEVNYQGQHQHFENPNPNERYVRTLGMPYPQARSIKLRWKQPGVYLCNEDYEDNVCQATEKLLLGDVALLEPGFNNDLRGIRLRANSTFLGEATGSPTLDDRLIDRCTNDLGGTIDGSIEGRYVCITDQYGIVLHQRSDWQGQCQIIRGDDTSEYVDNLESGDYREFVKNGQVSSVTTFLEPVESYDADELTGGVWLCRDNDPEAEDLESDDCIGPYRNIESGSMPQGWDNEVTSIIVEGPYMATLFQHEDFTGKCQVFKNSDANLRDDPLGRCGCVIGNAGCGDCTESFVVIPRQGVTQFQGTESEEEEPTGSCSDYEHNETECINSSGCYWYEGTCHSTSLACGEYNNENECIQPGQECYWYENDCHDTPEATDCDSWNNQEVACFDNNCYYNYSSNTCHNTVQSCYDGDGIQGCSCPGKQACCKDLTYGGNIGEANCGQVEQQNQGNNENHTCLGWNTWGAHYCQQCPGSVPGNPIECTGSPCGNQTGCQQ